MGAAAELRARLEAAGCVVAAPVEHPVHGAAEHCWVDAGQLPAVAALAKDAGFFYESMTCVDRIDPHGMFELLHTFNRYAEAERLLVRAWTPQGRAVPSLSGVFGIAAWNEREAWEFYGLEFTDHPNLTWLLLPEDTEYRPLLKTFTAPPPSEYDDSLNPPAAAADEHESEPVGH